LIATNRVGLHATRSGLPGQMALPITKQRRWFLATEWNSLFFWHRVCGLPLALNVFGKMLQRIWAPPVPSG
jgi:hypothetical protein